MIYIKRLLSAVWRTNFFKLFGLLFFLLGYIVFWKNVYSTSSQKLGSFLENYGQKEQYLLSNLQIDPDKAVPQFARRLGGTLDSIDHLHFTTCYILKNMHSVLQTIMCYLQPNEIKQRVYTLNFSDLTIWHPAPCVYETLKKKFNDHALNFAKKDWTRMVLVRHPIARLISGWVHFCHNDAPRFKAPKEKMCYGCFKNLSCFIYANRDFHMLQARTPSLTHPLSAEGIHYRPQNWACGFYKLLANFTNVLQYERTEKFSDDFLTILEQIGSPPDKMAVIRKAITERNTLHTTYFNPVRQQLLETILKDQNLLKAVVETYYYDFVLFKFDSVFPYSD